VSQIESSPISQIRQEPELNVAPVANSLLDTLEKIAKISGFIAVFGYLSLRSHLNYLGIPSQAMLGVDRYLAEAFQFLTALFCTPDLFLVAAVAVLFIALAQVAGSIPSTQFSRWRRLQSKYNLLSRLRGVAPPLVLIAVLCGVTLRGLQLLTSSGFSVAVGTLQFAKDGELAATAFRPAGEDQFLLAALFCALGFIAHRWRPTELRTFPEVLWKAMAFGLILLALQLPILYGIFVRPATYSKVEVQQKDRPSICGVLVLDGGERIALWRAKSGKGWVDILSTKEIQMRAIGDVDVLWAAAKSFGNAEDSPSCKDTPRK
jgi:hypothetical protein